jgi:hypothetical protein
MVESRNSRDRHLRGSNEQCPKCGSRQVHYDPNMTAGGHGPGIAACANCKITWETFTADQLLDQIPYSSFVEPCNNCAFRKGSPEQSDPYTWMKIKEGVEDGSPFYCHKGVPIAPGSENGFDYPTRKAATNLAGKDVGVEVYDQRRLRLCRGWLNTRYALMKKQRQDSTDEVDA